MFGEHDHDRVDARIMFGGARGAGARPAAAIGQGRLSAHRTEAMAAVPVGEAERGGKGGRVTGVERRQQSEMGAAVDRYVGGRQMREKRGVAVESEEQGWFSFNRGPLQAPCRIERGGIVFPVELARGEARGKRGNALGKSAECVGAVEARAGEEGIRQPFPPAPRDRPPQPGDTASAVPLFPARHAAATSRRRAAGPRPRRGGGRG